MNKLGGLCECGCGEPAPVADRNHTKYGWVKGQPKRFIKGHNGAKTPHKYIVQDRGFETPCWVWTRCLEGQGYGRVTIGGGAWPSLQSQRPVLQGSAGSPASQHGSPAGIRPAFRRTLA